MADPQEHQDFWKRANKTVSDVSSFNERLFPREPSQPPSPKPKHCSSVEGWSSSYSTNVLTGLAKGIVSFGTYTAKGVVGVVTEPIKGAKRTGALGFVTGLGKGVTGLVTKPIAGVLDFGAKTAQGLVAMTYGDITPAEKQIQVFGQPLEESLQQAVDAGTTHIAYQCIKWIDSHALQTEGLFRVPGDATRIQAWKQQISRGETIEFSDEESAFDVCGLFKEYLKEIPGGLITEKVYEEFKNCDSKDTMSKLVQYLQEFSLLRRGFLFYLLALLDRITQNSEINQMNIHNLTTCMALVIFAQPGMPNTKYSSTSKNTLSTDAQALSIMGAALTSNSLLKLMIQSHASLHAKLNEEDAKNTNNTTESNGEKLANNTDTESSLVSESGDDVVAQGQLPNNQHVNTAQQIRQGNMERTHMQVLNQTQNSEPQVQNSEPTMPKSYPTM